MWKGRNAPSHHKSDARKPRKSRCNIRAIRKLGGDNGVGGGGSQPGTQLSPVSEAAISGLSETLRDIFAADRECIVAQFNCLRRRN